jgi:hypothetical protein
MPGVGFAALRIITNYLPRNFPQCQKLQALEAPNTRNTLFNYAAPFTIHFSCVTFKFEEPEVTKYVDCMFKTNVKMHRLLSKRAIP